MLLPKDSEECRTDGFMLDAAPRREGDPPVDARSPRQILSVTIFDGNAA